MTLTDDELNAWRAYACAAVAGHCACPDGLRSYEVTDWSAKIADAMLAEERKRRSAPEAKAIRPLPNCIECFHPRHECTCDKDPF